MPKKLTIAKKGKLTGKKVSASKGKPTDGRANPAVLDVNLFDKFTEGLKVPKTLPKGVAQQIRSTPVRHQSGKGTRMIAEGINGDSKTACIRYMAAKGWSEDGAKRAIASLCKMMTPGVWSKNWRAGENGDCPDISPETIRLLRQYAGGR